TGHPKGHLVRKPLTKFARPCVISETRSFPARAGDPGAAMAAGWIFHSGRIFDGLRVHPTATAVDLRGRLLTPGFTDAHVHAVMAGLERLGCDLSDCARADAVLAQVAGSA